MAVRSRRLWGPVSAAAGATQALYTVASGRTAVVRSHTLTTGSAVAVEFQLRLTPGGATIWRGSLTSSSPVTVPYMILNPGETLYLVNGSAVQTIVSAGWGSLLDGAPL